MSHACSGRVAWALWSSGAALGMVSCWFAASSAATPTTMSLLVSASQGLAFVALGAVGLLVATRRPDNAIGWLYLGAWVLVTLGSAVSGYANWGTAQVDVPAGVTQATWLTNWFWVPQLGVILTFPFLLFPDGHLLSRRWRPVAWLCGSVIVLWSTAFAFSSADYTDARGDAADNPYSPADLAPVADVSRVVLAFAFIVLVGACVASLALRFRRGDSTQRAQLKWLILSSTVFFAVLLFPGPHGEGQWIDVAFGVAVGLIPLSVGVAILRYHLYEIDRIISRTTAYAVVTGLVLLTYLTVVTLSLRVLPGSSSFAVAAGTLTAAALFRPALRRVQHMVDHRFNRRRYDAEKVVDDFGRQLHTEIDGTAVVTAFLGAVDQTLQPARTTLWLRGPS